MESQLSTTVSNHPTGRDEVREQHLARRRERERSRREEFPERRLAGRGERERNRRASESEEVRE